MYLFKNRLWKSERMVSLMKRLPTFGASRAWLRNTTSSSHRRLVLKSAFAGAPEPPSAKSKSGFPVANSSARACSAAACSAAAFSAASFARSALMRSSSASNAAVSSSAEVRNSQSEIHAFVSSRARLRHQVSTKRDENTYHQILNHYHFHFHHHSLHRHHHRRRHPRLRLSARISQTPPRPRPLPPLPTPSHHPQRLHHSPSSPPHAPSPPTRARNPARVTHPPRSVRARASSGLKIHSPRACSPWRSGQIIARRLGVRDLLRAPTSGDGRSSSMSLALARARVAVASLCGGRCARAHHSWDHSMALAPF